MNKKQTNKITSLILVAAFLTNICCYGQGLPISRQYKLAPASIFSSSAPDEKSAEFKQTLISKIEFLTIALSLYSSLVIDKCQPREAAKDLMMKNMSSPGFYEEFSKFDFRRKKIRDDVLYIPYGDNLEVRVYSKSRHPRGLSLEEGQRLLEEGLSALYGIEVVSPLSRATASAKKTGEKEIWLDALIGGLIAPASKNYKHHSETERNRINEEEVYREIFYNKVLPKLKRARKEQKARKVEVVNKEGIKRIEGILKPLQDKLSRGGTTGSPVLDHITGDNLSEREKIEKQIYNDLKHYKFGLGINVTNTQFYKKVEEYITLYAGRIDEGTIRKIAKRVLRIRFV